MDDKELSGPAPQPYRAFEDENESNAMDHSLAKNLWMIAVLSRSPPPHVNQWHSWQIYANAEDPPSFLYKSETAYDEENEDMGLFCGFLIVRVYRHIFTGPSSAMNPTVKVNKSKARKFKLTEVTGRTITYASVQVCDYFSAFHVWSIFIRHTLPFHPWANGARLTIFSTFICFMIILWPCLKRIRRIPGWSKLLSGGMSRSQSCLFFRS